MIPMELKRDREKEQNIRKIKEYGSSGMKI